MGKTPTMFVVENYKGIEILTGIVCYDIRYFVSNNPFAHFLTIEEARNDIDSTFLDTMKQKSK